MIKTPKQFDDIVISSPLTRVKTEGLRIDTNPNPEKKQYPKSKFYKLDKLQISTPPDEEILKDQVMEVEEEKQIIDDQIENLEMNNECEIN